MDDKLEPTKLAPGFWERMDQNSHKVAAMPQWMKGSPVNYRQVPDDFQGSMAKPTHVEDEE